MPMIRPRASPQVSPRCPHLVLTPPPASTAAALAAAAQCHQLILTPGSWAMSWTSGHWTTEISSPLLFCPDLRTHLELMADYSNNNNCNNNCINNNNSNNSRSNNNNSNSSSSNNNCINNSSNNSSSNNNSNSSNNNFNNKLTPQLECPQPQWVS